MCDSEWYIDWGVGCRDGYKEKIPCQWLFNGPINGSQRESIGNRSKSCKGGCWWCFASAENEDMLGMVMSAFVEVWMKQFVWMLLKVMVIEKQGEL